MDAGLTHEEYQRRGESGEYRPDLERYFLPGMVQPPLPQSAKEDPELEPLEPPEPPEPSEPPEPPEPTKPEAKKQERK